ncbi:hypothetical protein S40285_10868 [Stachybotrys chlorohalonatus IBT 40285]|uniref:Uncharacterized protein n=1 Tax=Stachybotrys chlorohalonatus (strain IBT 40285) TaxID=1283841 RepID=A0A084QLL8_STAC4|nr:hypothetical protein S40285_10868 [Stachybotrys chlorohalonata IBT 40285]
MAKIDGPEPKLY